jgi:hypothetical protein
VVGYTFGTESKNNYHLEPPSGGIGNNKYYKIIINNSLNCFINRVQFDNNNLVPLMLSLPNLHFLIF